MRWSLSASVPTRNSGCDPWTASPNPFGEGRSLRADLEAAEFATLEWVDWFNTRLFNSTNFEYVLRNLEVEYILVMGILADQCMETAVQDECDRGFLMTLVDDACATHSAQRHREAARIQGLLPGLHHRRAP